MVEPMGKRLEHPYGRALAWHHKTPLSRQTQTVLAFQPIFG